ncbi:hypothetical protein VTO73DRAFT_7032 [Trametes versicolor]
MLLSLRDTFIVLLSLFWLLLLWRQFWQPTRTPPMASYNFSAKTPICHGRTTVLEFAAPSPSHYDTNLVPTILKVLDALDIVDARARSQRYARIAASLGLAFISPRSSYSRGRLRASQPASSMELSSEDEKPEHIMKSEPAIRTVPSPMRAQTPKRDVFRIKPILARHVSIQAEASGSTPPPERIIRSASRSSLSSAMHNFTSVNDESNGRFRSDVPSVRSPSPVPVAGDISSDDDSGHTFALPYIKRQPRPTPWFGSEGTARIVQPPILRNQHDVRIGDIFYHKTPTSVQLWLRKGSEDGHTWQAVPIGHRRLDDRCLSLTEKKLEPSWVCSEWCGKRITALKRQGLLE